MNPLPPNQKPVRALVLYFLLVFMGGALLAPWVYWAVQSMAHDHGMLQGLATQPFSRYVNRSLLVLALAGLWPLLRQLGVDSWASVGLVSPTRHGRQIAGGFVLGFISLALVAGIALLCRGRDWNSGLPLPKLFSKLAGALATAAVVSVLEEILFRGGIFGGLRRVMRWPAALAVSSCIYAIVHFFARTRLTGDITWLSGWQQLGLMLTGFADLHALIPGFLTLTLAGVILGLAYQRTGNLWFSIGLHAGWIFWLNAYGLISTEHAGANVWLWGGSRLLDGWLAGAAIVATLLIFLWSPVGRKKTG